MEEIKKEETNKYSEYKKKDETRKSIEKDMTKTVLKLFIITSIMAVIFCGILFYLSPKLRLVGLVFAIVFLSPIIYKLFSVRSNKNIKYKDKEEKE